MTAKQRQNVEQRYGPVVMLAASKSHPERHFSWLEQRYERYLPCRITFSWTTRYCR